MPIDRVDPETRTDAELLRATEEDPEAFGSFYDRHVHAVLAFFYRRTAAAQWAADLTAETFAKALESRRNFRDSKGPARAWLLGIARHELSRSLRRNRIDERARRRLGIAPLTIDDAALERVEELVDFRPIREAVKEALNSLGPKLAEAVTLRIGLDLPYDEVARRLGCTEAAARVRVSRGLTRLNDLLEVS